MRDNGIRFLRRLRTAHPNHIRIAQGMAEVGLFLVAAKLIGAIKEMAIAHRYGVSGVVDAYMLAFTFVTWLPQIVWSVGSLVLVPVLVALTKRPDEERQFLRELNGSAFQLGLATAALVVGLGSCLVPILVSGWSAEAQDLVRRFTWQLAPVGFLLVLSASLSIRLQARERQSYTFLESMPAIGILLFLLLLPESFGSAALILGTLVGAVVQVGLLVWMVCRIHSLGSGMAFRRCSTWWNQVYVSLGILAVGQAAISLAPLVDNSFASQLGEGAVAMLGYAKRIMALLTGLGATAIGRALLPVLSQAVADGNLQLGRIQVRQWTGMIFLVSGLMAFLGWLFAPSVVALVFQRGAFTAGDTAAVARVFRFGLLQLPFYCSGIALVQWFAANGRHNLLAWLGIIGLITKCILNAVLTPVLGVAGIALASGGVYMINMAILVALSRRDRLWNN